MRIEFSTMVVIGTELNVQEDVNQRPPYPWYIEPPSFGRNEGVQYQMKWEN
jgi:hypothetical protein